MKALILAALVAVCAAGQVNADPTEDALKSKAEACLRAGAPEIASKADSLSDAVGVLLDLCTVEMARVDAYDSNERAFADWQARTPAKQMEGVSVDPLTGEMKTPPGFRIEFDSSSADLMGLHRVSPRSELIAIAARAVIAARKPAGGK